MTQSKKLSLSALEAKAGALLTVPTSVLDRKVNEAIFKELKSAKTSLEEEGPKCMKKYMSLQDIEHMDDKIQYLQELAMKLQALKALEDKANKLLPKADKSPPGAQAY